MSEAKYTAYEALGPFFEIIMKGLSGVVAYSGYGNSIRLRSAENLSFIMPTMAEL
jgi:hypothetical protein